MDDPFMLERFLDAQNPVYCRVCAELQQGFKRSHWMWFIFPQIEGLGHSPMARKFEISSLEEAKAYLRHPILGRAFSFSCLVGKAHHVESFAEMGIVAA